MCPISNNPYMIIFGVAQILFSQVPDFDRLWWLSYVATAMSFLYSFIGLGLCIGKATGGPSVLFGHRPGCQLAPAPCMC